MDYVGRGKMIDFPPYMDCKNTEWEFCQYFMHEKCKETCAYAHDIKGTNQIGIGAVTEGGLFEKLRREIE